MIEMLGVLAIIGVLSVGGIAGYSKAMNKYRINKAIEHISLIAGNVRAFFGPQKNYVGVNCIGEGCDTTNGCQGNSGVDSNGSLTYAYNGCPIIKKAKILPDDMIMVTDGKIMSITNPFGGWVNLEVVDKAKSGDSQAFYILYTIGDNMEACIELLSQDWAATGISVNNYESGVNAYFKSLPVTIDKATEKCAYVMETDPEETYLTLYFDIDPNSEIWKNHDWAD